MRILANKLHPSEKVSVEVNDYIPLYLVFGNEPERQIFYRQVSEFSLLEVGFSEGDGRLCSIKVTQTNGVVRSTCLTEFKLSGFIKGLICCDSDKWVSGKLLDNESLFDLCMDGADVCLRLQDGPVTQVFKNENVCFGCNGDELLCVLVSGLDASVLAKIEKVASSQTDHGFL